MFRDENQLEQNWSTSGAAEGAPLQSPLKGVRLEQRTLPPVAEWSATAARTIARSTASGVLGWIALMVAFEV